MVPCPSFHKMAVYARNNPHIDHGIHLTLTCEWENYKFGPVLPTSEVPSLVDENGHFYKKRDAVKKNATTEDVQKELDAQIQKAIKFGLKPTHIDSHMYSVGVSPEIFSIYRKLGKKYGLPVLISRDIMEMIGLNPESYINQGDLLIDHAYCASYQDFESGKLSDYYTQVLENLGSGINVILIHPAFDDEEMKSITVNHPNFGSEWRQIDFDYFKNPDLNDKLKELDVKLITWDDIRKIERN